MGNSESTRDSREKKYKECVYEGTKDGPYGKTAIGEYRTFKCVIDKEEKERRDKEIAEKNRERQRDERHRRMDARGD